jgi:hypothetical protein
MAGTDDTGVFTRDANQTEPFGGSKGLLVKFFYGTVRDEIESEKAGYPKHKRVEMIRIIVPGDRDNIVEREVYPVDLIRFESTYQKWKAGDTEQLDGLPLAAWPQIEAPMVEDLKYFKVYTVEQLAALSDSVAQRIGPIQELRRKAQSFLAAAKDNAFLTKMEAEGKAKDAKIAGLEQMVAQLNEKLEDFITKPSSKSRL